MGFNMAKATDKGGSGMEPLHLHFASEFTALPWERHPADVVEAELQSRLKDGYTLR